MILPLPLTVSRGWIDTTLERMIHARRSVRHFKWTGAELGSHEMSQIMYAAYGVTRERRRSVPSAGAIYPLTLYTVVQNSISVYVPSLHAIESVRNASGVTEGLLKLTNVSGEPLLCIVISADFTKTQRKYGGRGKRYVYMECGHSAQNIQLQVTALGFGSVCIGAFSDGKVKSLLKIKEDPLYIIPIGIPAEGF